MFDEVYNDVKRSRITFSDNVKDAFGSSVCSELYDELENRINAAEDISSAADIREAYIRAQLLELRMIL